MRTASRTAGTLALACALAALAPAAQGQRKNPRDPANCDACRNDPEKLKAAGLVSHGPFEFGKNDTDQIDAFMATSDIRWLETEHFKIGFALGTWKVKQNEKKKFLAELTRLATRLPDVKPETTVLDPWLRLHLYAQRCEEVYTRFVELVGAQDVTFADGTGQYVGEYRGEGPYLGQKRKYEVLVLPSEAAHVSYLTEHCGLRIRMTQRWHYVDKGSIGLIAHAQQGNLRQDAALHGHVAFNLAHNLFDGFMHYSYDTPVWLHEGLAHYMEREIDPENNSFDSGEGAVADMTSKGNWKPEVLKLIATNEAPTMAQLMALKSYSELKLPHHFTTWSIVDYMLQTNPKAFGQLIWKLKTNFNEQRIPTGANLPDVHRDAIRELFGMSYPQFDEAWRAWCKEAYKPGVPKGGDMGDLPLGGPGGVGGGG